MVKKIIQKILRPRHFWRNIGFDELSELYTSMMLRSLALNLVGIFIPVFLYKSGYSIRSILFFFGVFFGSRVIFDIIAAYTVAWKGPKHTMIFSYLLQVASLVMLVTLKTTHMPIYLISLVWGSASSFFFTAYHVDFSKIKHSDHGGKEVGYMFLLDRVGGIAGPLLGGFVAGTFGAEYTIFAAIILFCLSLIPLFATSEPVKLHQKLDFSGVGKSLKRDALAQSCFGIENTISVIIWPLFVSVFIFKSSAYTKLGFVTALGVCVAILASKTIGQLIDNKRGGELLRYSLAGNIVTHLFRFAVGGFGGVVGLNMANEFVTVGYRIPYTKGFYDAADDLPGHRIVYIATMEVIEDVGKALVWLSLALCSFWLSDVSVLRLGFIVAIIASLGIMTQKFPALKDKI